METDKYIFLSVHADGITLNDDDDDDDERCTYPDSTLPEVLQFIGNTNETLTTVIAIDANTTLPPNIPNTIGKFTLTPLPTHNTISQNRILNLIEPLSLKDPQTYAQKGFTNLVTRKENESESQIEHMLIPQHKKGKAYVSQSTDEEIKSDHHPIALHIED